MEKELIGQYFFTGMEADLGNAALDAAGLKVKV